jgi:hypothetical protein
MGLVQNAIPLPYGDFEEFLGGTLVECGAIMKGVDGEHFVGVVWGLDGIQILY